MKKHALSLAVAVAAISLVSGVANAGFILTSTRITTTIPAGASVVGGTDGEAVDVITFKIQNTGGTTGTKLNAVGLDATTPGTTTATDMIFQTYDSLGNGTGLDININGLNVSSPAINYGSSRGSFIRFGTTSGFGVLAANPPYQQDPGGTGFTTFDPTIGYSNLHDFQIQGGVNGGTADTTAINLASIVVPVGTPVTLAGTAGGDQGVLTPVSLTDGGSVSTPEPASLGVLAVGAVALLNRRKKA